MKRFLTSLLKTQQTNIRVDDNTAINIHNSILVTEYCRPKPTIICKKLAYVSDVGYTPK